MNELQTKFATLETTLQDEVLERDREIHCAILAILAQKHFFMVGVPGTAKSFLIKRLTARIEGFGDDGLFQWLLTRHTTPEEIFGPANLAKLREGEYVRVTDGKLPVARIAFLDEMFKASSSILNSLLMIANERVFHNGSEPEDTEVCSIFAASNELPQDDGLAALWDRLHFRFEVHPIREGGNFVKMLTLTPEKDPEKIVSWDDVLTAQQEISEVAVPELVLDNVKALRDALKEKDIHPSERRFHECMDILRAEAWMAGRSEVKVSDIRVLRNTLWENTDHQREVEGVVLEVASPLDREAHELIGMLTELESEFNDAVRGAATDDDVAKQSVEIFTKMKRVNEKKLQLKSKIGPDDSTEMYDELHTLWVNLGHRIAREGFKMDSLGST